MQDIIAAIATPRGKGGVAIIRISGPGAAQLLPKLFTPCPKEMKPRYMYYGSMLYQGKVADKGLAVFFAQGHSFTMEETIELHCHGGQQIADMVLRAAIAAGARPATPGEFTKRAFLSGRIDLSEAEAVGNVIDADSTAAVLLAAQSLSGGLLERVEGLRSGLTDMLASIEAAIDYPEEIAEQDTREDLHADIRDLLAQIKTLSASYEGGRMRKDGISVCLLGRPNAGKSSLLNFLCGRDSAIVTDIAGTTRDVLCQTIELGGMAVHLYDTAGLRQSQDTIEAIGVERAWKQAEQADLVLYLVDAAEGMTGEDQAVLSRLAQAGKPYILLYNKVDLTAVVPDEAVAISIRNQLGLETVRKALLKAAGASSQEGLAIASERHLHALQHCIASLKTALAACGDMPMDCIAIDLHHAWEALGEITGQSINEEIIDRIFAKFCLGK